MKLSRQFYNNLWLVGLFGVLMATTIGGTHIRIATSNSRLVMMGVATGALVICVFAYVRSRRLLYSPLNAGLFLFVGLSGLAMLAAPQPRRSIEFWIFGTAIHLPIAVAALYLWRQRPEPHVLYRAIMGVGSYLFLLTFISLLAYFAQADEGNTEGFRLWGVLDNPAVLAMFLAVTVPCIAGHLLDKISRFERILAVIWLSGAGITILANATRSGFIATVIGTGTTLLLALTAHPGRPIDHLRRSYSRKPLQTSVLLLTAVVLICGGLASIFYVQSQAPDHAPASSRFNLYEIAFQEFLRKSLAGGGSGGFVTALVRAESIPPFGIVPHAHNLFLDFAADMGIVGLVGFFALITTGAYVCVTVWRKQPEQRRAVAGAMGGLTGFLAAGLLDQPASQVGLLILVVLLLTSIAAQLPAPQSVPRRTSTLLIIVSTGIVIAGAILALLYNTLWGAIYNGKVENGVDWTAVAEQSDGLRMMDPSDPLAALQSAYAWANLGQTDTAIERFEHAVALDPDFGLHYLNLSTLYSRAGRPEEAVAAARQAVERAYDDPAAWLNLGLQLEFLDLEGEAIQAYREALSRQASWLRASFWSQTETRQLAWNGFITGPLEPLSHYYLLTDEGDQKRAQKQPEAAAQAYEEAANLDLPRLYRQTALGLLAFAQGNLPDAQQLLAQTAHSSERFILSADAWYYLGDIASANGDERASLYYQEAYSRMTARGIGGLTTRGDLTYASMSFRRIGLVSDYLPDVVLLDAGALQEARFAELYGDL